MFVRGFINGVSGLFNLWLKVLVLSVILSILGYSKAAQTVFLFGSIGCIWMTPMAISLSILNEFPGINWKIRAARNMTRR